LVERSHFFREDTHYLALLLLRPARRLSHALRHVGKNQRRCCGTFAGCHIKRGFSACERSDEAGVCCGGGKSQSACRHTGRWRRVRAVLWVDSGFWPNRERRQGLRGETGFARREDGLEGGR